MAIAQSTFFIPDDIATGLATGLFRRIGGVVRYASGPSKGQIVKHLQPIDLPSASQAQGVGTKALQLMKQHKGVTAIVVAGVAAIGAGAWAYSKFKDREAKAVTEFRAALKVYIDAIRKGNMDTDKIDDLMAALEVLKGQKDYEQISIRLSTEDLEVLVGRIYEYTLKLAKDNFVDLTEEELRISKAPNTGTIINLQNLLKAQKRIFSTAA